MEQDRPLVLSSTIHLSSVGRSLRLFDYNRNRASRPKIYSERSARNFRSTRNLAVEMIHHQLRSLMVHLARLYATASPAPFAAIGLVRRFRQAVERSFRASTSVRDYAQMLGVTTSHLSESLRLETGLTAGELIRARLLLEAKRLLLHSEQTIAEIGYELGFEDPSYFSRFVRREIETSPVELRNRIREKYRKFMQ